ncbi:MAG: ThiF family adenylyltransferase [Christensenellales bacterium]
MGEMDDRTKLVIGEDYSKIKNCHIAVLGVGGVGGYVVEMLARLGVEKLTVVDFDIFDKTNLNRQILALTTTIGRQKCFVAKERIAQINPKCNVYTVNEKINRENISTILCERYDYVIDAIDDIPAKIEVIKFCKQNNTPLVCAMGTGNRAKFPNFQVENLWKTSYDGLARKLRTELKKIGIDSAVDVCYTKEPTEKTCALGSVVYYPLMCAGVMVSFVINKILEK